MRNSQNLPIKVISPNVKYTNEYIEADYDYQFTTVDQAENGVIEVTPHTQHLTFRTARHVPRVGVMLVGWGGNNGATFTAAVLANRLGMQWDTRRGQQSANWYGSLTQAGTVRLGGEVYAPVAHLLPTVHPDDLVIDGWDISGMNMAEAAERAHVLEPTLLQQLRPHMAKMRPRPSIYAAEYIAANQADRADNTIPGTKQQQVERIIHDINEFKQVSQVDTVIVVWTANTERFSRIESGIHDTHANLQAAICNNHPEVSPSTQFAYAAISQGAIYINGSPQNTFVPGIVEMAERYGVPIAGDDFKSGQTKLKSVLVDFLIGAGLKTTSIVSYNHLGNNDGKNLSAPQQFRSKEVSKSNVVDDMIASNPILYQAGEKPDHVVVIKYVPYVGDSKRALDEYTSEILMGGTNTLVVHNTCEDSLLATPIILDLIVLAELFTRVQVKRRRADTEYSRLHPILSALSYLCKAPLVPKGTPVVNAFFKQRACIENILKACLGLPPENNMLLEYKMEPPIIQSTTDAQQEKVPASSKSEKIASTITNGIL